MSWWCSFMILCDLKCYYPKIVNGYLVPCGRCYMCKLEASKAWQFRLSQEDLNHNGQSIFVTLTYDDDFLHTVDATDIFMSSRDKSLFDNALVPVDKIPVLNLRDIQLFNKRLRHKVKPYTYFIVGEYGPTTLRPHYHGIFFGLSVLDREIIEATWQNGFVTVSQISQGRIGYTAKYSLLPSDIPEFLKKSDYKPFMRCSKGIGLQYLQSPHVHDFHNNGNKLYVLQNGYKKPLPRYYRYKLFSEEKLKELAYNYKKETSQKLSDALALEKEQPEEFARQLKYRKDQVEQHKHFVRERLLKKSKL